MAKPLKFYQTLNQAPKGPKHGKHRRAGTPAHDHSAHRADNGTGGPVWNSVTWSTGYTISGADFARECTIPYAGIRTGELIGTRAWLVVNNHDLRSLAHHFIWEPGATVTGKVNEMVEQSLWATIMGGVYAHFSYDLTMDDIKFNIWDFTYPYRQVRAFPAVLWFDENEQELREANCDDYLGVAIGTVKLWGEVVEHERGYRAEFAKIVSIDEACGVVDIEKLRAKYFVG